VAWSRHGRVLLQKSPFTFLKLSRTSNIVWNYSIESWISRLTPLTSFYLHSSVLTSSIEQSTRWGRLAGANSARLGLASDEVTARGHSGSMRNWLRARFARRQPMVAWQHMAMAEALRGCNGVP
jgi:hypothetical protein